MSIWNKIVLGTKFLFVGFESATDYAIHLLNKFLGNSEVIENTQKARAYVGKILGFMRKYQRFCPVIWVKDYEALLVAVQTLSDAFEDNQLSIEEVNKAIADFKAAVEEWMR